MKSMYHSFLFIGLICLFCGACKQQSINSISAKEVQTLVQKPHQYTIVDVRTPEEYSDGTLPGAINIDVKSDDFVQQIEQLDKDAHYILHCRSGKRSAMAYGKMETAGFKHLKNMDGGYLEYSALSDN